MDAKTCGVWHKPIENWWFGTSLHVVLICEVHNYSWSHDDEAAMSPWNVPSASSGISETLGKRIATRLAHIFWLFLFLFPSPCFQVFQLPLCCHKRRTKKIPSWYVLY